MSTMFSGAGGSTAPTAGGAPAGSPGTPGSPGAQGGTPTGQPGNTAGTPPTPAGNAGGNGSEPYFREKIKVDGKEEEISFATKEELVAHVRKIRAADKRFEQGHKALEEAKRMHSETAKARQEAEEIRAKYGDDALSAAFDRAIESGDPERIKNVREAMEKRLAMLVRQDMMEPTERELANERRLREAAERKIKEREQKDSEAKFNGEKEHWRGEFVKTITTALELPGVPNSEWSTSIMATLMKIDRQKGYKTTPEALAEKTKNVIIKQVGGLLANSTGEQIIALFPDVVKKIRAADLAMLRRGKQPPAPAGRKPLEVAPPADPKKPSSSNGYMNPDEWKEWVRENARKAQADRDRGVA